MIINFLIIIQDINDEFIKIIKDNRNLDIITYSKKNNHKELHDALKDLVGLVENERDKIAQSRDW